MTHNRTFLLSMGVVASYMLAFELLSFSLPLLALEVSGTGTGLAVIKGAGFVPQIIFAIFIGVINDRIRKAIGFRIYTSFIALCAVTLWTAMMTNYISVTTLAIFMIFFSLTGYALGNLQFTLVRLVVKEDKLADAMALTGGIRSAISTVAPALAGLALLWIGHTSLVGVVTLLLCISALASCAVRPVETLAPPLTVLACPA